MTCRWIRTEEARVTLWADLASSNGATKPTCGICSCASGWVSAALHAWQQREEEEEEALMHRHDRYTPAVFNINLEIPSVSRGMQEKQDEPR